MATERGGATLAVAVVTILLVGGAAAALFLLRGRQGTVVSAATSVASLPAVAAQQPDPPRTTVSASIAMFSKDRLRQCIDMRFDLKVPDASFDPEKARKKLVAQLSKGREGSTEIEQPCAQAFADRPVFGRCTVTASDGGSSVRSVEYWYGFRDVFHDDVLMKECIDMKGQWSAMSRTSEEYRRASMEDDADQLDRRVDDLKKSQADSERAMRRALRNIE